MKKCLSASIIALALLTVSLSTYAVDRTIAVCKVQIHENGWAYVSPCGGWVSTAGNVNGWVMWDASTDWGKQAFNMAVIAHQTANPLFVRSVDSDSSNHYDRLYLIRLNP